jgi:hypothetical protein
VRGEEKRTTPPAMTMPAMATLMNMVQRHLRYWVSAPPSRSPADAPAVAIPP